MSRKGCAAGAWRRSSSVVVTAAAAWGLAAPPRALAQDVPRSAPNLPSAEDDGDTDRVQQLEERVEQLSTRLAQSEEERRLASTPRLTIHGYVDFGYFVPNGNAGVGFVQDLGHAQFPQYSNYSWVFLGDILATAVNSRGEVASLGQPPGVARFDSVNSGGAPGFIANEVNLRLGYALSEQLLMRTSINFVPRSGHDFALGDFMDVDLAEMEYVTHDGKTSIFAGKIMPVFGIEYKERKSDQRFGITPSLIQRYTSGSQLGLKVRSKLFNDWLILAGSVTNDSSGTEQFHFQSEIDKNAGKTANGRAAISIPIGEFARGLAGHRLELGASGEIGEQDWQPSPGGILTFGEGGQIYFWGADLQYQAANFALKAQFIRGHAPGTTDGTAWRLDLHNSGYVELNWQVLPWAGFLLRMEQRDAFVAQGMDRAYITKERRFTGGIRAILNPHLMLKAEYLANFEYGMASFTNDIFTSSLVIGF